MRDPQLLETRVGAVVTLTLNRPGKRNAMTIPMLEAFRDAVRVVAKDDSVRVVIVAGAGKAFCAGLDLKDMGNADGTDGAVELPEIAGALHELERLPMPTIAMMQGDAIAGGLELALHCDLRVAGASARMGMPLARIGLVVPYPLTQKLLDTVGTVRTKEMLFTGRLLDAATAREAGLVTEVVPDAELETATRRLASDIAANAPLSLRAMKAAILEANGFRAHDASQDVRALARDAARSSDVREGLRAVFEKRRAAFEGR
jgi:enoyl-CoA hydratase/carnithine racemase